ncbi:uncharacterized protein ARB_05454 [Trichophyton benhamiae CBS 112371]|uniref:RRM domain-containing protein n=1 Tax=Arthroderma benhamiae (strain ATCC MYA-4681 / CBS 112371) TaxID=663331 RepID=D4AMK1_ARTBC|nr:uncharacterized protein ARB_05454 [Trichophyton benhamiae CBS 112371]EFE35412.1 hypothetical protein ARB_05454 [Trichophyton benhamiae CBS 112371]
MDSEEEGEHGEYQYINKVTPTWNGGNNIQREKGPCHIPSILLNDTAVSPLYALSWFTTSEIIINLLRILVAYTADSKGHLFCLDILPPVNKQDIEEHFGSHGTGKITEIKLMQGFGFIEYEDAMDAKDVVPGEDTSMVAFTFPGSFRFLFFPLCLCLLFFFHYSCFTFNPWNDAVLILESVFVLVSCSPAFHGTDFKGERLTVQFARGPRRREPFPGPPERSAAPRPRRTIYRMQITGLPETSWQLSPVFFVELVLDSSPSLLVDSSHFQSGEMARSGFNLQSQIG